MIKEIRHISINNLQEVLSLRRYLHANPEVSFKEHNTSAVIKKELEKIGIPCFTEIGTTGLIALIEGKKTGITIGFRAELDALPIQEQSGVDFSSQNPGIMHACGHDVHMANLVGTAKVLWDIRNELQGSVLLIFQPGEELLPGGAKSVLESDVFAKNKPDIMLGLHILPELLAGKVGFRSGAYMASGDEVYITVKGKGGHAALPHTLIDPVVIASNIIVGLQQIVSRKSPSTVPTVLSFGKFIANGANNVIPDQVQIDGTFRTMDETWRAKAHTEIEKYAKSVAQGLGGDCEIEIRKGYPALNNNPELTNLATQLTKQFIGNDNVIELPLRLTTDDFAYYAQNIPSVYFRIGAGFSDGEKYSLHSGKLVVNEYVLEQSVGITAWLIYGMLSNPNIIRGI